MNTQHTADKILIDRDAESQRDLLSNAGTQKRLGTYEFVISRSFQQPLKTFGQSVCMFSTKALRFLRIRRFLRLHFQ